MLKRTPEEIVQSFIDSGFVHMQHIPNNRVFVTDTTTSTLAWVEDNVVIEYYLMLPNKNTNIHSHPFANQFIFISGEVTGYMQPPNRSDLRVGKKVRYPEDANFVSTAMPIGHEHGFESGSEGAVLYNIQIWPDGVSNPTSASIEYLGEPLGPVHQLILQENSKL